MLLLALLDRGLKIEAAQKQRLATVPRPAARRVTKMQHSKQAFLLLTSAAPLEPFHLRKAHVACNVEKTRTQLNPQVVIMMPTR